MYRGKHRKKTPGNCLEKSVVLTACSMPNHQGRQETQNSTVQTDRHGNGQKVDPSTRFDPCRHRAMLAIWHACPVLSPSPSFSVSGLEGAWDYGSPSTHTHLTTPSACTDWKLQSYPLPMIPFFKHPAFCVVSIYNLHKHSIVGGALPRNLSANYIRWSFPILASHSIALARCQRKLLICKKIFSKVYL